MNTAQFDLIIVGAGILGLSAAIQAAEQGLKVQVFEKDAQAVIDNPNFREILDVIYNN